MRASAGTAWIPVINELKVNPAKRTSAKTTGSADQKKSRRWPTKRSTAWKSSPARRKWKWCKC